MRASADSKAPPARFFPRKRAPNLLPRSPPWTTSSFSTSLTSALFCATFVQMFTRRAPTTRSTRFPSAKRRRASAFASRSSEIPSSIPRAISSRAFAKHPMADERLLILRMGALGDIVHTLPAVAALRESFPRAQIDWLVDSKWSPILEGNPDATKIISIDRRNWRNVLATIRQLRAARYTIALDFQSLYR